MTKDQSQKKVETSILSPLPIISPVQQEAIDAQKVPVVQKVARRYGQE